MGSVGSHHGKAWGITWLLKCSRVAELSPPDLTRSCLRLDPQQSQSQSICRGSQFVSNSANAQSKLRCTDCKKTFGTQGEATKHAEVTGHSHFEQTK